MIRFAFKVVVGLILLGVIVFGWKFASREFEQFKVSIPKEIVFLGKTFQKIKNSLLQIPPCTTPITYSIGALDPRFKISRDDLKSIITNAIAVWEKPIGRDLFMFEEDGDVVVNLIYDTRQESTNRIRTLGLQIENTKESFNALKQKYDSAKVLYTNAKKEFDILVAQYDLRASKYEELVASWNRKGGAPEKVFAQLEAERAVLNNLSDELSIKQKNINELVTTVNAFTNVLNRIAQELNISIGDFNTIGSGLEEFQEGVYVRDASGERIDIFEFGTRKQLLRVLAHEFGHALGLDHLENPLAIMYKRNQATNETLTKDDLGALRKLCGLAE
jgi:Matrixin